jgi:predicted phage tail protein
MQLTTIHLVGSLGKAIGQSEWQLDVRSPAEALRAIDINTRGALTRYLTGPARDKLYRIALQKRSNVIDPSEGTHRSGLSTIFFMPTIRGRNSGAAKVIAGVALIALSFINPGLLPYTWSFVGTAGFTAATTVIAGFGISLVLGGITQMLTPTPQGASANPDQAQSTAFPGTAGAVTQGGCVPLVYGRALVSPIPVCMTTTNNDVSTSEAGTTGGVTTTPLPGGGSQYQPDPNLNPA